MSTCAPLLDSAALEGHKWQHRGCTLSAEYCSDCHESAGCTAYMCTLAAVADILTRCWPASTYAMHVRMLDRSLQIKM